MEQKKEMKKYVISVIVPIYNVEKYLKKCIESILNQTYRYIEIILVDDGSTDKSGCICDTYEKNDSRVKVIHKKNGGLDSARKAGIRIATGDYVGYVDGDDWIEHNMYEKMMAQIDKNHEKINCVICGIVENYEDRERSRKPYLQEGTYNRKIFSEKLKNKLLYTGEFFRSSVTTSLWDKIYDRKILPEWRIAANNTCSA